MKKNKLISLFLLLSAPFAMAQLTTDTNGNVNITGEYRVNGVDITDGLGADSNAVNRTSATNPQVLDSTLHLTQRSSSTPFFIATNPAAGFHRSVELDAFNQEAVWVDGTLKALTLTWNASGNEYVFSSNVGLDGPDVSGIRSMVLNSNLTAHSIFAVNLSLTNRPTVGGVPVALITDITNNLLWALGNGTDSIVAIPGGSSASGAFSFSVGLENTNTGLRGFQGGGRMHNNGGDDSGNVGGTNGTVASGADRSGNLFGRGGLITSKDSLTLAGRGVSISGDGSIGGGDITSVQTRDSWVHGEDNHIRRLPGSGAGIGEWSFIPNGNQNFIYNARGSSIYDGNLNVITNLGITAGNEHEGLSISAGRLNIIIGKTLDFMKIIACTGCQIHGTVRANDAIIASLTSFIGDSDRSFAAATFDSHQTNCAETAVIGGRADIDGGLWVVGLAATGQSTNTRYGAFFAGDSDLNDSTNTVYLFGNGGLIDNADRTLAGGPNVFINHDDSIAFNGSTGTLTTARTGTFITEGYDHGIGVEDPDERLHVNGKVKANSFVLVDGTNTLELVLSGTNFLGIFTTGSTVVTNNFDLDLLTP